MFRNSVASFRKKRNMELYRPYSTGTIHAPVRVRSTGHYTVPKGWSDPPLVKPILELYWCVSGCGRFGSGASGWLLNENQVCFYFPGDRHEITAESASFDYWWLTIDGPNVPFLIDSFRLERPSRPVAPCPEELFLKLAREIRDLGRDGEYRAGATAYEILTRAMLPPSGEESGLILRFKQLVEERYDDPALSVRSLSTALGVHRSTLTRLVARHCGMPPQEYLTGFRLQIAMQMLHESAVSIKEIAEATGFSDQNYFGKVFLKRLGKTPTQMRRF